MNEKIKEILDRLDYEEWKVDLYKVPITWCELYNIRDCITNLQQDLDKANDIIEKDRQFYKCRMDEYVELKKENEELNRMCELYSKSLYNAELTDYKLRCEKAIEYIKMYKCDYSPYELTDSAIRNILNILDGSDGNE